MILLPVRSSPLTDYSCTFFDAHRYDDLSTVLLRNRVSTVVVRLLSTHFIQLHRQSIWDTLINLYIFSAKPYPFTIVALRFSRNGI